MEKTKNKSKHGLKNVVHGKHIYDTERISFTTEQLYEEELQMKYLIRRMNVNGQWVHVATITVKPLLMSWEVFLRSRFGPGRYNIAVVEEGVPGMRDFASFNIGYDIQYLGWVPEKPNEDYINKHYGGGDYLIGKFSEITPFAIIRDVHGQPVEDILNQGIQAISSGHVIFRVKYIPPE